ncbi:MAG TPA: protein-methionine-sulfoxide reductase heme-binding subunit MsrQ [Candidatus Udaeobacter sp.]|nr:protein-methionine-sulfoxide reductase heme-binding subunit MsrQ [Candidatus Udaeobacter sp.]
MAARQPWLKPAILTGALIPLAAIVIQAQRGTLSANPIAEALNRLGLLALIFLILALAMTPLRVLFGWTWPLRIRRMLGLLAFFYAALHFTTYLVLDQGFAFRAVFQDVLKRRFIFVGFAAFVLLIPLAITSTNAMVRRLGFRAWQRLHRLAYVATILGVIHFVWRVKKDVTEPAIYGAILASLLGFRLIRTFGGKRSKAAVIRPAR